MIVIDSEMPKSCHDCIGFDDSSDYPTCRFTQLSSGYTFNPYNGRMKMCPIKADMSDIKNLVQEKLSGYGFGQEMVCEINRFLDNKNRIEDFQVGDEVIVQDDIKAIITGITKDNYVYVVSEYGWTDKFGSQFIQKTGRHFNEIENVIKVLREKTK